jgi:UDP-GlcNAc:undecaprenyl-phosphate GlcNAc-1-phosphate transferase
MEGSIANSLLAFLFSCLCIGAFKPISKKTGLTDTPCERKTHEGRIPLIGGLSIYCALLITYLIFDATPNAYAFITAITLLVFIGVIDDRSPLPVKYRLTTQLIASLIMIFFGNVEYHHLGELLNSGLVELGSISTVFTVIAVIGTINAFNMMDGIDGLCSGVAVVALTFLLFITSTTELNSAINITALIFCLLAYMMFNLQLFGKRFEKIFMGDAGSMLIGFSIAWLLAETTQIKNAPITPAVAIWVIALPLMDMGAIMIRRVLKGQSPFQADRNHLHHILIHSGFSPRKALMIILSLSATLTGIGYLAHKIGASDWELLYLWWIVFTIYTLAISHAWKTSKIIKSLVKSVK